MIQNLDRKDNLSDCELVKLNGFEYLGQKREITINDKIVLEKLINGKWHLWQIDDLNDIDQDNQLAIYSSTDPKVNKILGIK